MNVRLLHGDCIELLATLDADSIDACVCDPPYGLEFMGKEWDSFRGEAWRSGAGFSKPGIGDRPTAWPSFGSGDSANATCATCGGRMRGANKCACEVPEWRVKGQPLEARNGKVEQMRAFQTWTEGWAREVYRVLKPGSHILVCGAPRSHHRMASGLEDAGFEIRDCLAWLYGSGFPKSLNLGEGLGTALKPAYEPIVLARKPFKGSVKGNVEKFGTGALNIDACRLAPMAPDDPSRRGLGYGFTKAGEPPTGMYSPGTVQEYDDSKGRWPANVVIDDLAALVIDEQSGELTSGSYSGERSADKFRGVYNHFEGTKAENAHDGSVGGASRFYYCAKPSREERDMGCYGLPERSGGEATGRKDGSAGLTPRAGAGRTGGARNFHPTVKPIELMRWLVRLVTPIDGTVIDPFLGSGTTGIACRYELRGFIGIEREAEYLEIARRRIESAVPLFGVSA